MTTSGYPCIAKLWQRGDALEMYYLTHQLAPQKLMAKSIVNNIIDQVISKVTSHSFFQTASNVEEQKEMTVQHVLLTPN